MEYLWIKDHDTYRLTVQRKSVCTKWARMNEHTQNSEANEQSINRFWKQSIRSSLYSCNFSVTSLSNKKLENLAKLKAFPGYPIHIINIKASI